MKYKSYALLSTVIGAVFFFLAMIIGPIFYSDMPILLALLFGLTATALLYPTLIITDKLDNLKYRKLEKGLKYKIVHSIKANMRTAKGVLNAKVYFTENRILFASAKGKEMLFDEIELIDIFKVVTDGLVDLNIYMKDNRIFKISSPEVSDILPFMKKHSSNMQNDD